MRLTNMGPKARISLSVVSCMLKCHSYMRHLVLVDASKENLLDVFEHMTDMESLGIEMTKDDNYTFSGQDAPRDKEGYSIKRLQKLEYLHLDTFSNYGLLAKIIQELQFPRLKHFILTAKSEANLFMIFLNMPALESLKIFAPFTEDFKDIIKYCKLAKNLIYLGINVKEARLQTESSVAPLFEACPSLKFLHFKDPGVRFSFNPHTKKILMLNRRDIPYFVFPRNVISPYNNY